ncbi:hypothetical protein D3C75_1127860 [compost metagenome]
MASVAVLGDDFIRGLGTAAASSRCDFHTLAFLTLYTHLADRFQSLGDVVVGRSLCADCPKGQYGSWYGQHFLD